MWWSEGNFAKPKIEKFASSAPLAFDTRRERNETSEKRNSSCRNCSFTNRSIFRCVLSLQSARDGSLQFLSKDTVNRRTISAGGNWNSLRSRSSRDRFEILKASIKSRARSCVISRWKSTFPRESTQIKQRTRKSVKSSKNATSM